MPTMNTAKYDAESDLPNLEQHNNHMAHVLTLDLYNSLRGKMTPSGFTVDGAIQTGVDNPGNFEFQNRLKFYSNYMTEKWNKIGHSKVI